MIDWFNSLEVQIRAALISAAGVLVAATFALVGVALTLRWNRKKQNEDREFALRKDVFLEIIGYFHSALQSWHDVLAPGVVEPEHPELGRALLQAQLVASRQTREAVDALSVAFVDCSNAIREQKRKLKAADDAFRAITADNREARRDAFNDVAASVQKEADVIATRFSITLNEAIAEFRREVGLPADTQWFSRYRGSSELPEDVQRILAREDRPRTASAEKVPPE